MTALSRQDWRVEWQTLERIVAVTAYSLECPLCRIGFAKPTCPESTPILTFRRSRPAAHISFSYIARFWLKLGDARPLSLSLRSWRARRRDCGHRRRKVTDDLSAGADSWHRGALDSPRFGSWQTRRFACFSLFRRSLERQVVRSLVKGKSQVFARHSAVHQDGATDGAFTAAHPAPAPGRPPRFPPSPRWRAGIASPRPPRHPR